MNYNEFITWLEAVPLYGHKDGLTNIKKLLERFHHPEVGPKIIHVAGTNGKGSVCSMLESVLRASGFHTGLYTSPHLVDYNERIMIDGKPISNEDFAYLGTMVKEEIEKMVREGDNHATFFEILTTMAFLYFAGVRCPKAGEEESLKRATAPVDFIVLETGVGGRLDATNAVEKKLLTIITSISLDHTKVLGSTLPLIAAEKAGILRENCPVILSHNPEEVRETILRIANGVGAPYYYAGEEEPLYEIPLVGDYQKQNLATVQRAIQTLREEGVRLPEKTVAEGLRHVQWPGRMEHVQVLSKEVILDGCHNPGGAGEMAAYLSKYHEKGSVTVLFSALQKKDVTGILGPIRDQEAVKEFIFTCIDGQDETERFASIVEGIKPYTVIKDPKEALLEGARRETKTLVICGSLYLIGEIKRILREESEGEAHV